MKAIEQPKINQSDFQDFLAWKRFKEQGGSIADLTNPLLVVHNPLCVCKQQEEGLCMKGEIRTKQHCPKCGGKFQNIPRTLICPACLTIPTRFYIDIYWKQKYKIYSDTDGRPLTSYELAHRVLTQIRQDIDHKTFDPKNYQSKNLVVLQFKNYSETWLKRYKELFENGEISPAYYRNLENYVNERFIPYFQVMDIREIRGGHINDFYVSKYMKVQKKLKHKERSKPLSIKTKSNIMAALKKLFNDACFEDEYIKKVPKFKRINVPDPEWTWADEEIQDKILNEIPIHHLPIFVFLTRQGTRPGEARAVQWRDFSFDNDTVTISRAFSEDVLRPFPKPRRNKILPLDPELKEVLLGLPTPIKNDEFVFYDQDLGKPYTTYKLSKLWRKACKQVGLNIKFYEGTRHSFASQAANRGVSIDLIGKFLGHQNQSASTRRYTHLKIDSLKVVMRRKKEKRIKNPEEKVVGLRPQGRGPIEAPEKNEI